MKNVYRQLFLLVMSGLLTACSGNFNLGSGGGGGKKVTAGNFFSPAVKSSVMDQDLIYNINFINNLIIQDLCNGDANDCDPDVADVLDLLASYDIEAPESILNGEFSLPTSGSGIATKMSAKATPISNYCSVPSFETKNVTVNGSTMTLAAYFAGLKRMENGSNLKICEIMNLREDLKSELKLSVAAQNGYLLSDAQLNETLRLRARREFLYVFVNTFLAFGTDLIGFCQWAGCTIDADVPALFASSSEKIEEGIEKNKFNIRSVEDADGDATVSTREFFDNNKGNTYLFVEQFFSQGEVINPADAIVKYTLDEANFCKFVIGSDMSDGNVFTYDSEQYDSSLSECVNMVHEYFSRLSFLQKANGEKNIQAVYTDPQYLNNTPVTIFNLKYTITYNSLFEIILADLKKVALSFMQHELEQKPDVAAELGITPQKINTLSNITLQGSFGIGASVTDINESQSIDESNLPALVHGSVTKPLYVLIPENVSDADFNDLSGSTLSRSEAGDVSYRMGVSDKTVRIEHKRGQSLYQDILGLNFVDIDLRFPPYKLTSEDFFVFDISVDELNGDFQIEKPVALSRFEVNRNGVLKNYLEMSKLDLTFKSVDTTEVGDTYKNLVITEAFAPAWNLKAGVDADSLPLELEAMLAQQSGGMISTTDNFVFQISAPQGSYFKSSSTTSTDLWFANAPDTGSIKPMNVTLTGTIASTTKSVGPYSISDEGASMTAALSSVMSKLLNEFPGMEARTGGSYTGNLDCGSEPSKAASINLSRSYSGSSFNQTITDFSMDGSQITSYLTVSGTYGPSNVNTAFYTHWDNSTYEFQYEADSDNIVQSIFVRMTDYNTGAICTGNLSRN